MTDEEEPRAEACGKTQFMRNQQYRFARRTKVPTKAENLLLIDNVESRCGFVEEEHGRLLGEHLCEQDALTLPARHGV